MANPQNGIMVKSGCNKNRAKIKRNPSYAIIFVITRRVIMRAVIIQFILLALFLGSCSSSRAPYLIAAKSNYKHLADDCAAWLVTQNYSVTHKSNDFVRGVREESNYWIAIFHTGYITRYTDIMFYYSDDSVQIEMTTSKSYGQQNASRLVDIQDASNELFDLQEYLDTLDGRKHKPTQ
jgi:hypothetical protein